jgi:hypothetical protein
LAIHQFLHRDGRLQLETKNHQFESRGDFA